MKITAIKENKHQHMTFDQWGTSSSGVATHCHHFVICDISLVELKTLGQTHLS